MTAEHCQCHKHLMIERKRLFHQAQTHKIMDTKGQAFVHGSQIRPLPQDGKSLRNRTKVTPNNRDSSIEPALVDQGHTRQTCQTCNKYSDSSTVTPPQSSSSISRRKTTGAFSP